MPISMIKERPVSLRKNTGTAAVKLTWTTSTDVDLGCFYETADGKRGVIQALGGAMGSLTAAPYVLLENDDRSGGCEVMQINLGEAEKIKRLVPFAYIYQGGNWQQVGDARVTVTHPIEGEFFFDLTKSKGRSCALMSFAADGNGGFQLTRLEHFSNGFQDALDREIGFPGLTWTPGTKS